MKRGFSLIELLVVIAIIAILVGIAAPYYSDYIKESKYSKAKADLDILRQAVILYNSREDLPYQGSLSSDTRPVFPAISTLGDNDFQGLQGQYLSVIPLDPWSKTYKLDPYGGFVYSDGPNSLDHKDDLREYYIKELALRKIEWEDTNDDRMMNAGDLLYLAFNKALFILPGEMEGSDFDVYENDIAVDASSATFDISLDIANNPGYLDETTATRSTLICKVGGSGSKLPKIGVHSIALKDEIRILQRFKEVRVNRESNARELKTQYSDPIRYAIRTAPIKITPKG